MIDTTEKKIRIPSMRVVRRVRDKDPKAGVTLTRGKLSFAGKHGSKAIELGITYIQDQELWRTEEGDEFEMEIILRKK